MDNNILKELNKLDKERIFWLKISLFVVVLALLTIFNWNYLIKTDLIFAAVSIGIITTIIWWYWTMSIIKKLISFKTIETNILNDITINIKEIKEEVKKTFNQNT